VVGGGPATPFDGREGVTPAASGVPVAAALGPVDVSAETVETAVVDERGGVSHVLENVGRLVDGVVRWRGNGGLFVGGEGAKRGTNVGVGHEPGWSPDRP